MPQGSPPPQGFHSIVARAKCLGGRSGQVNHRTGFSGSLMACFIISPLLSTKFAVLGPLCELCATSERVLLTRVQPQAKLQHTPAHPPPHVDLISPIFLLPPDPGVALPSWSLSGFPSHLGERLGAHSGKTSYKQGQMHASTQTHQRMKYITFKHMCCGHHVCMCISQLQVDPLASICA